MAYNSRLAIRAYGMRLLVLGSDQTGALPAQLTLVRSLRENRVKEAHMRSFMRSTPWTCFSAAEEERDGRYDDRLQSCNDSQQSSKQSADSTSSQAMKFSSWGGGAALRAVARLYRSTCTFGTTVQNGLYILTGSEAQSLGGRGSLAGCGQVDEQHLHGFVKQRSTPASWTKNSGASACTHQEGSYNHTYE
eukprot:1157266-Pelagomonas_calceolata.AAC.11